jgi:hypothetical protein
MAEAAAAAAAKSWLLTPSANAKVYKLLLLNQATPHAR